MAKKTNNDLLVEILSILNQTLGETKKKNRTTGESNAPGGAGVVNADKATMEVFGNTMKVLSSALPPLAKISKKQYETIANGIKELGTAIRSFGLDKDTMTSINNMLSAIVQIHTVISNMSENFIKTVLSLNPIKAWILGKRLGRFYGLLAKGMTAAFVKQLVDIINQVPPNKFVKGKTFKERITNLGLMMAALLAITPKQIMQLWFMGVMLGPKIGAAIGGFFKELIDKMAGGPGGTAKATAAAKVSFSAAAMIATLTLSLIALVVLFNKYSWQDLLGGAGLLIGVVTFALGIIKILSSKWFKNNTIKAFKGIYTILALIGGLTLALIVTVSVAKRNKWEDILWGTMMLGAVIGFALLVLKVLSGKTFEENALKGLAGLGSVILLILGMTLALTVTVLVAKRNRWEDIVKGIIMLGAVIGFATAVLWILSRDTFQKNMVKGLLGVGAIILMIAGVSAAMLIFSKFLTELSGVTDKTIKWGIGLTVGMIVGMGAIAFAAGALITGPQAILFYAGFAAVETIAIMIASISGAMLLFTNFLKEVSGLKKEDIEYAIARITEKGGMIDCLMTIVNALDKNIRWKAAPKIAMIGMSLRPLMTSLSQFVDVVQKMASLKIADEWDKNGRPTHYLKLEPKAFKDAADNLTDAFSTFIDKLVGGLNGITDSKGLKRILKTLFPRNKKRSGGIGNVIRACSDFVDVVIKMATLLVPDEWDNEGNPKHYRKLKNSEFGEAASTLSEAFGTFLTKLGEGLESLSIKSVAILKILGGDISAVLQGVGAAFGPIIQIAAGKIAVGDQILDINKDKLTQAATDVVSILTSFIDSFKSLKDNKIDFDDFEGAFACINNSVDFINKFAQSEAYKENFSKNTVNAVAGLTSIIEFLSNKADTLDKADRAANWFKDALEDFVDGVRQLNKLTILTDTKKVEAFTTGINSMVNEEPKNTGVLVKIINFLQDKSNLKTAKTNSVYFKEAMKNTADGLSSITPYLKATPTQILNLSAALKELDAELLEKEQKRADAIQSISTNFKDMAGSIDKLNKSLDESLDLMKSYDRYRMLSNSLVVNGVRAVGEATSALRDKVVDAFDHSKKAREAEEKKTEKQKQNQELAQMIALAISNAMNEWSETHRDLTVQFGDDGKRVFGEVYNN